MSAPEQVEPDGDDVCRAAPATLGGEWDSGVRHEIREHAREVEPDGDAADPVHPARNAVVGAGIEDVQLGDRDRLCERHRNGHEQDQVPRLVDGQQFHVVRH